MAQSISPEYHDLLNAANTAVFTTLLEDGSPNSSPVWFWFDGTTVSISTRAGRVKHRSLLRDPRVALTVVDPEQSLRYLEVRGTASLHDDPDFTTRDRVAAKHGYTGADFDPPDARRVTIVIEPHRIIEH